MSDVIGAYEAKTHLARLLDRVEHGESLTITRNGRPVARLVPAETRPDSEAGARIVDEFRKLREQLRADGIGPFSHDEIIGLIREGRKY